MGKPVLRRGIPGLAVALGVSALIVFLLGGGGGSGLAQDTNKVFLPLVMKGYPPPSLEDHFDANANNWTPFLENSRLKPEQWYWAAGGGYQGGGYRHNMYLGGTEAHDALSMYLGGNSQGWTDYRLQTRVNLVSGSKIGLWFRGTFVDEPGLNGRKLTGYYFAMASGRLELWQMQTEDECDPDTCTKPWYLYHFANPILLTQVSHSWQKGGWYNLKVEVEGSLIKCYVNDVLKIQYNDTVGTTFLNGTVGLSVYKAGDARFDDVVVEPL